MKIEINLGEILTKAWKITWKFKVLWIFGILAGCGGNNSSNFNYNGGSNGGGGSGGNNNGQVPDFLRPFQGLNPEQALREFLGQYWGIIAGVILLLCLLWFLFYFLGLMGKIGLIKGAGKADTGAETLTFGELWTESTPYFWRMFGLSLLVGLPSFLLTLILLVGLGLGVYAAITGSLPENGLIALLVGVGGAFVLMLCCLSLVMLVVGLIVEQAYNAIVLEDRRLIESLGRGWEVFSQNWLSVIVVGLIQGVLALVIGLAEALIGLFFAIPLIVAVIFAVASDAQLSTGAGQNVLIALGLGFCCTLILLIPFSLLMSGIQNTYFQSVWTLTYRRLTDLMKQVVPPAQPEAIEAQ